MIEWTYFLHSYRQLKTGFKWTFDDVYRGPLSDASLVTKHSITSS